VIIGLKINTKLFDLLCFDVFYVFGGEGGESGAGVDEMRV
jgi:hypothetical protein